MKYYEPTVSISLITRTTPFTLRMVGWVTFSCKISENLEYIMKLPKILEVFQKKWKAGNNLMGCFPQRMITAFFCEK
jgi:hypothetical protein